MLLNRNYEIVGKIKHTVFQGVKYKDKDVGTATIFQDDVRISTNVLNADGSRAIGTRVAEDVYNQVVLNKKPWVGRAYVVNDWYITAYEPIRNIDNEVIGILYVGILEQKYLDIRNRTIFAFVTVSFFGILVSVILGYFISRSIHNMRGNMTIEYDDKGKRFTDIVTKRPVYATLQTTKHLMRGHIHVRRDQRIKDELDMDEKFIAVTDVSILGDEGQILYQAPFLAINWAHII